MVSVFRFPHPAGETRQHGPLFDSWFPYTTRLSIYADYQYCSQTNCQYDHNIWTLYIDYSGWLTKSGRKIASRKPILAMFTSRFQLSSLSIYNFWTRGVTMLILHSIMYNLIGNTAVKLSSQSAKYFLSYCQKQNVLFFIDAHCSSAVLRLFAPALCSSII